MPSVTDDVYAIGAGADVIAVTDYIKYPAEARTRPSVGTTLAPSIETIVSLHPDLVLEDANMSDTVTITSLQRLGIAVFMVRRMEWKESTNRLQAWDGPSTGKIPREIDCQTAQTRAAVRRRVSGKPVVSILMPVGYDPIITIGKHAFITEMIEIAGGRSVTGDLPRSGRRSAWRRCWRVRPKRCCWCGVQDVDGEDSRAAGLGQLPAVKNKRVYYVDDRINFPARWPSMHWRSSRKNFILELNVIQSRTITTNSWMIGKRGANPPLPRNCKRRGTAWSLNATGEYSGKAAKAR